MIKKRKRRTDFKEICSIVLVIVLLVLAISGINAILEQKKESLSSFNFSLGSVNGTGKVEESTISICTTDFIKCQGLVIEPDFETKGFFQVFFYDENKNFIGHTPSLSTDLGVYEMPLGSMAKYCRIMITPELHNLGDTTVVGNLEIAFYEVFKYASQYNIMVNKNQNFAPVNLFKVNTSPSAQNIKISVSEDGSSLKLYTSNGSSYTSNIDVSSISKIAFYTRTEYFWLDASNKLVGYGMVTINEGYELIDVPENASYMVCTHLMGHELTIFRAM